MTGSNNDRGPMAPAVDGSALVDEPGRTEGMTVARATEGSLAMRRDYEMTQADWDKIIEACRPVPYMVIGGHVPRSPQENANDAWCELGSRMGFDGMTVMPNGKGRLHFSAISSAEPTAPSKATPTSTPTPVSAEARSHEAPTTKE